MEMANARQCSRPIQIIDFDSVDGKNMLVLNQRNLEAVLKPVEKLPIAFISIAGPSRQGKSFLLSFMVRYLESLRIDESDWMGWENPNQRLEGFEWRDGLDPQTSGVWFWGEAFVVVDSNDRKVAIILMDTQGTFDERSSAKDWSSIVGLSMLTSSCMIFNCLHNIQEDVLNSLESYIQYGLQAMEQDGAEDTFPFHKITFLIRDWGQPAIYPYGTKGGEKFIKEKMRLKPEQSPQAQTVRKAIKKCFEYVECFLMPPPGEASKERGFTGALAQLSDNYAKKIEIFISDLLNPDEIPIKSSFGNDVVGEDMITFFTKYVEMFNGDDIPSPMSMVEAGARLANQTLVNKSKSIYLEHMKKKSKGVSFLPKRRFWSAHEEAKKRATKNFNDARKIGDSDLISEFKVVFDQMLKMEYNTLHSANKTVMENKIADLKQESMDDYRENMNDQYPSEEFGEEKKLLENSQKFINKIKAEIEEKLSELEEDELENVLEDLEQKLDAEQRNFANENTVRKVKADMFMRNLLDELMQYFSETVKEEFQADEALNMDELTELLRRIQTGCANKFKSSQKKGNKAFVAIYKTTFEEQLEAKGKELIEIYLTKQGEKVMMCDTMITGLVSEYKDGMTKEAERTENEEYLREKHSELEIRTLSKFKTLCSGMGSRMMLRYEQPLKELISTVFQTFVLEKHQEKLEKNEESFEKAYSAGLSTYKRKMEHFSSSVDYYAEDDLRRSHLESLANARQALNDYPKLGSNIEEKTGKMLTKLEEQTKTFFENLCQQNELRKATYEQKSLNDVTQCCKGYELEMKSSLEMARSEENLNQMHKRALHNAVESFQTKCIIKDDSFVRRYTDMIVKQTEETYVELLYIYTLKMKEQADGVEKALHDAKRVYHEEMAKHYSNKKFMVPSVLANHHTKVSQIVMKLCCAAAPLTETQKEILLEELKIIFERYQEQNQMNTPTDPAIGIDLGTTYSCVAVYHKGQVEVISNKEGHRTTPSYVAFKDGDLFVGNAAKNQAHENPEHTIFDAKRIIGRAMTDEKLQHDITLWPFKVVEENGSPKIEADGKTYFPEQISAEILKEMRSIAEDHLKCKVTKAVITVPAYFTDGQRQATIDAGELAGLEVLKIINEPTAAAIAYKQQRIDNDSRNVLIFDLGGGTFDVAVLEISKGSIEVKSVDGDTHLGGEDFDNNMVEHCATDFARRTSINILDGRTSDRLDVRAKSLRAIRRVRNESERQKIALATASSVDVVVDSVEDGQDLRVGCTRSEFEKMNKVHFEKAINIVEKALKSSGKRKQDINDIVLVGGSTRIPKIQDMLSKFFDGKALCKNINPDEAVAVGAAIQAAILNGKIAKGSADYSNISDVIPFSIGVETYGGDFSIIIPKNTGFPCSIGDNYKTAHNNQTSVQIIVFQGEDHVAVNNTKLGEFYLNGIPPAKAGAEEVKVKMEINEQGVLNVTAVCSSNGVTNTGLSVNAQKWRMGKETIKKILAEGKAAASSADPSV